MRWLLTPAFVTLSWMIALSQSSIQFNHYTIEHGLSDNTVGDIIQDDNGFTWVATANGLNRFDGVHFKSFFKTANTGAIPDNHILSVRKWKDHSLVIGTENGIGVLNTQSGQCQTILIPAEKEISRQTNHVQYLEITTKNEIVAGTSTGVYVFNDRLQLAAKTEAGYTPEDIGSKRLLFCISLNLLNNGDALAETTTGIQFYDHQRKIFFPIGKHPNFFYRQIQFQLAQHHVIHIDSHNRLFCVNYYEPKNQIIVFDLVSGKRTVSYFPTEEITWFSRFSFHSDTMFSLNSFVGGFYLLRFDTITLQVQAKPGKMLAEYVGGTLMLDRENRWWAGTDKGLFSQSLIKQQFKNVDIAGYLNKKSSTEGVMGIYGYKKKLYVGLESINGGILVFDENNDLIRKIDLASLHPGCNMIWNIDTWNEDTLIIGTQTGLVLLNTNNYHFHRINYPEWPAAVNENPVTLNYTDRHGTRWIGLGNTNGVLAFYPESKTWQLFSPRDKNARFKLRYPLQIAEDKNGDVWMMHPREGGLTRWSYEKQTFDTLIRRFDDLDADENDLNCLASDQEGNLWIYLYNHGIVRWRPEKKQWQSYPAHNYWQNESVRALYTGVPGQLWIIFRQALSVMNLRTGAVKTFTKGDGLPDYSATATTFYYDTLTQSLTLGFPNSFTRFKPREIFRKEEPRKIFITEINILNDTIQADPQKTVRLKYSQNDLAIHFSAIDYESGHQNIYEYRLLENENSPWINIGHQQTINLNNLPAGKYVFQVRLSLPTSNVNHPIASASIIITPPFYRTSWFYLLCIIILSAGIFILYRFRIHQLLQVQHVRNRISSDLHDDIGSRLTNIQILSALGEQRLEQPEQASIYLRRIVNEVQTSGEALDDIVWSINSKNDSGEELAARMRRYAADIFEGNPITCNMNVNDNISAIKLNMEKRRDLYLVFKEALNNILKHSAASTVNIELLALDNKVLMEIVDDGKGFDVNKPGNRNGLKNMKKRIEKWKGKIMIESTMAKGTVLHVALPIDDHLLKRTILRRLHLY